MKINELAKNLKSDKHIKVESVLEDTSNKNEKSVLWFDELKIEDIPKVGGKNASLGEMYSSLKSKKINVPYGFATTSYAYNNFLKSIKNEIKEILKDLNTKDIQNLQERGKRIRNLIIDSDFSETFSSKIKKSYEKLEKIYGKNCDVAIRSSATAEDLPDASFAGQQETYLNISGFKNVLHNIKLCFASLFTDRAISYRVDKNFSHFDIALSCGVQKMVRSDLASSGVMFTLDTESGFEDVVFITGAYGLGENVVQGAVTPDEFYVFKPTLKKGYKSVISKKIGEKHIKMIYGEGSKSTKNVPVPKHKREEFTLNEKEILKLAKWACEIEDHYSKKRKHHQPMDIEWAKDGITNELYIVQARPETIHSNKNKNIIEEYVLKSKKPNPIVKGLSIGSKISTGKVKIIHNIFEGKDFNEGDVLVTEITDPDWEPIMKKASAIITNRGGRTCHAAIISREMGVPAVVGCENATKVLKENQKVTIDCSSGEEGLVYEGILEYYINEFSVNKIPETKTKIMLNIGNPNLAFQQSFLPVEGVGLAREEFIINSYIKIHPNAILNYEQLKKNPKAKVAIKQIKEITKGYSDKKQYYIDKLCEGFSQIASAFYPKKVILRLSDFKSNEYRNLIGGEFFEPEEENPMIGFRGASRYYSEDFKQAFELELKAVEKARKQNGLFNIELLIPMVRTTDELISVLKIIEKTSLMKDKNRIKVNVMCEVPSNVILADQFLELCDGFSIGSNDLTQLTLGLDRDSPIVSHIFDERNQAIKDLVTHVINKCRFKKKYIGICGQAPSDYPEFARFLVERGIESISLNPDSVIKTKVMIAKYEKTLEGKKQKLHPGFIVN